MNEVIPEENTTEVGEKKLELLKPEVKRRWRLECV